MATDDELKAIFNKLDSLATGQSEMELRIVEKVGMVEKKMVGMETSLETIVDRGCVTGEKRANDLTTYVNKTKTTIDEKIDEVIDKYDKQYTRTLLAILIIMFGFALSYVEEKLQTKIHIPGVTKG